MKIKILTIVLSIFSIVFFSIDVLAETVPIILPPHNPYYKKIVSGFQKTFQYPSKIYYLSSQTEMENENQKMMNEIRATSPPFIVTIGEDASVLVKSYIKDIPIVFSMVYSGNR